MNMSSRPVIVLEFNELTATLMDRFIAAGHLPHFAALRSQSQAFLTDANESQDDLEPWIQWITVHTGLPYSRHRIRNLGDSARLTAPAIWDHVSAAGDPVWVCGSMNGSYAPGLRGAVLPDPWSVNVKPNDESLLPYFNFVRTNVLEYTRDSMPLSARDIYSFVSFMVRNGLTPDTAGKLLRQLVQERVAPVRWRRASCLDMLQWDLFVNRYQQLRPRLSTFFVNSTAHYQHAYWRNMQPELFSLKPSDTEQKSLASAVLYGYRQMDTLVRKAMQLAGDEAVLLFVSALGQQPCLNYEQTGGKTFYKPLDVNKVVAFAGLDTGAVRAEPVMSEQFHLRFRDAEAASQGAAALARVRLVADGRAVLRTEPHGDSLIAGCALFGQIDEATPVTNGQSQSAFGDLFYHVDLTKSGMHHRIGMCWIRVPGMAGSRYSEPRPLIDVAPTILDLTGLPKGAEMPGTSMRDAWDASLNVRTAAA